MDDNEARTTRWCVLNDESYAPPRWPIFQLAQDPLRAYEASFYTAEIFDDPGKTPTGVVLSPCHCHTVTFLSPDPGNPRRVDRGVGQGGRGAPSQGKQYEQEKRRSVRESVPVKEEPYVGVGQTSMTRKRPQYSSETLKDNVPVPGMVRLIALCSRLPSRCKAHIIHYRSFLTNVAVVADYRRTS